MCGHYQFKVWSSRKAESFKKHIVFNDNYKGIFLLPTRGCSVYYTFLQCVWKNVYKDLTVYCVAMSWAPEGKRRRERPKTTWRLRNLKTPHYPRSISIFHPKPVVYSRPFASKMIFWAILSKFQAPERFFSLKSHRPAFKLRSIEVKRFTILLVPSNRKSILTNRS